MEEQMRKSNLISDGQMFEILRQQLFKLENILSMLIRREAA